MPNFGGVVHNVLQTLKTKKVTTGQSRKLITIARPYLHVAGRAFPRIPYISCRNLFVPRRFVLRVSNPGPNLDPNPSSKPKL